MAVNSIGDFIKSIFPTLVNKNGSLFQALLTDGNNGGTIEKVFIDLEDERKTWCKSQSIYEQEDEQLQITLDIFSILTQLQNESTSTFLKRNELLYYRTGDTVWGDKWNILNIFKTFFDTDQVYIVNNTESFTENLLQDGNFEKQDSWVLHDCEYEREARFEETMGILFNASGMCYQTVSVESEKTYFLHFFLKGNIRVQIQNNNGYYWHPSVGEFGEWNMSECSVSFESTDVWNNKDIFFISDEFTQTITIRFLYEPGYYAFLDYVRLNLKDQTSTFSLIAVFDGVYSDQTASLAPGTHDPIIKYDYDKMGYFAPGQEDVESVADSSLDFFDDSSLENDVSPVVSEGTNDIEPLDGYDNMPYFGEETPLAPNSPVDSEEFDTVNYDKVTYFDDSFVFGSTGKEASEIYKDLLDIVQPAGVTSVIELLTREEN